MTDKSDCHYVTDSAQMSDANQCSAMHTPFSICTNITKGALPTQTDHIFRTSLFWDITQRRFVVIYRRFGKKLWVPSARIKQSKQEEEVLFSVTLEDETDSLETSLNDNLHCVTSQKS